MKKKIAVIMTGVLCIASFTACGRRSDDNRKVIEKDNKQITVLQNKKQASGSESAVQKINNLKDIRALDWIDENTLLIMKENINYPKIQLDSTKAYPKNLYEYDINTGKTKLIAGSNVDMSNGVLSPDRKYIFYKEGVESNLTGYILNRQTGQKFKVTNTDSISNSEGRWMDNNTVIFSEFPKGGIYTADINGNVKPIKGEPKGMVSNAAKIGDKIYYTTIDGKMYEQNSNGTGNKFLKDNVVWLIPSPDSKSLAIVKRVEKTKMALIISDLDGKEKKTLAEGTQIFGANWSPDQYQIAYSIADTSGKTGLFIADVNSGKSTQLTVDADLAADQVMWSPSSKKLIATNVKIENNAPQFITYIIQTK